MKKCALLSSALCAAAALICAETPAARADEHLRSLLPQAQSQVDLLARQLNWEIPIQVVPVSNNDEREGSSEAGRVYLSENILKMPINQREMDALLLLVQSEAPDNRYGNITGASPAWPDQFLALGVAAIGAALDKPVIYDPPHPPEPVLGDPPKNMPPPSLNTRLAARLVANVKRTGGCSGPLVDMLHKAGTNKSAPQEFRTKAKRILKALAHSIYPPDHSCIDLPK